MQFRALITAILSGGADPQVCAGPPGPALRGLARRAGLSVLLAATAFAQTASFPKPNYFRQVFEQTRTQVDLRDPVKLKDFVAGGKR